MNKEDIFTHIDFLDSKGLYIGIIPDTDGEIWLVEICNIPLGIAKSRTEALILGINEGLKILENENL